MTDLALLVQRLQSKSKAELKQRLSEELGERYQKEVPNSLRNDFLEACCTSIRPGVAPSKIAQSHPEFDSSWRNKKQLATALRMLLSDMGIRKSDSPLVSLNKSDLIEIITAIQLANEDSVLLGSEVASTEPPSRPLPPDCQFDDVLLLENATEQEISDWVANNKQTTGGQFAVYTLDCTPPLDEEWGSIRSLRAHVDKKVASSKSLDKVERAAAALNNGERVYYVGFTNDVVDRVGRHRGGAAHGSGRFTNTFRPQALVDVEWYDSEREARRQEPNRARELTTENQRFAYWE